MKFGKSAISKVRALTNFAKKEKKGVWNAEITFIWIYIIFWATVATIASVVRCYMETIVRDYLISRWTSADSGLVILNLLKSCQSTIYHQIIWFKYWVFVLRLIVHCVYLKLNISITTILKSFGIQPIFCAWFAVLFFDQFE